MTYRIAIFAIILNDLRSVTYCKPF